MKPRHIYNQVNDSVSNDIKQEDTNQKKDIPMPAVKNDPKSNKAEEKKDIPQIARISADLVNIRKEAKADADILGTAVKNAEFKVDKNRTGNGYVGVIYGGIDGYIREDLVTVIDNPAYTANTVRKI